MATWPSSGRPTTVEEANWPLLYDVYLTHKLVWPSLTVDWLPGVWQGADGATEVRKLLLGTHTSGGAPEHHIVAEVRIRPPSSTSQVPTAIGALPSLRTATFAHTPDTAVHRARRCPGRPGLVASVSEKPVVLVTHHAGTKAAFAERCEGQTAGGFALDWATRRDVSFLTGTDDGQVYLYDLQGAKAAAAAEPSAQQGRPLRTHAPVQRWSHSGGGGGGAASAVNAVGWSCAPSSAVFASAGDDGRVCVWDLRESGGGGSSGGGNARPACVLCAPTSSSSSSSSSLSSSGEGRCLAWAPGEEHLLASGGDGAAVQLWDTRLPARPLASLRHWGETAAAPTAVTGHAPAFCAPWRPSPGGMVGEVRWWPGRPSLLISAASFAAPAPASSSSSSSSAADEDLPHAAHARASAAAAGSEVIVWDLARLGEPDQASSSASPSSVVLLNHRSRGPRAEVSDMAVSGDGALVAVVDTANRLEIWRPAKELLAGTTGM